MIEPVVDVVWVSRHHPVVLADVRWYLDGRSGAAAYAAGHLPGAVFVDLTTALAAPPSNRGGRHPLPDPEDFARAMADAGISEDSVVVAYDDAGGASAGRLVWLLRSLGVDAALLDGGMDAWDDDLATDHPSVTPGRFAGRPWDPARLATIDDLTTGAVVVDARAGERYRGETEPIDARAGHVPGAVNLPFADNLDASGRFLSSAALRRRFASVGIDQDTDPIVYCGSGVTACHDLLALERAGLGPGRLYPGSWSAYAATDRPLETGAAT